MQVPAMQLRRFGLILVTLVLAAALSVAFLSLAAPEAIPVRAAASGPQEWVIAVTQSADDEIVSNTMWIIDPVTDIMYGPVLTGELGSERGQLLDVAVTPDGNTALVANFSDWVIDHYESIVYFVDVSNPISPSVITSVTTPMFAEDIVVAPNGKFALVTDGGASSWVAVIDLPSRTLAYTVETPAECANAVEIAPNGTVIVADYLGGYIHSLYPDASGQLTVTGSYSYALTTDGQIAFARSTDSLGGAGSVNTFGRSSHTTGEESTESLGKQTLRTDVTHFSRPLNVAVAPDGQTVLVADVSTYNDPVSGPNESPRRAAAVYQIVAPGVLSFTGAITDLTRYVQSIAFNPAGTQAYLAANGLAATPEEHEGLYSYRHLAVANITGPGQVSLDKENAADYPRGGTSQLFGVDTLAVANNKAYVANPTLSGGVFHVQVVDLSDYSVRKLDMPLLLIPTGITVIPIQKVYLPFVPANQP